MLMRRIILLSVPALPYNIFPHYLINGTIFENYLLSLECALILSTALVRNNSCYNKNWATLYEKYRLVFMWSNRLSCQILMKLEFSQKLFAKYSNIKVGENPFGGSRVVPFGRKDRETETNSHFSKFRELS